MTDSAFRSSMSESKFFTFHHTHLQRRIGNFRTLDSFLDFTAEFGMSLSKKHTE